MKKILFFISTLILFLNVSVVKADEITSFTFMDKGNNSFIIGANGTLSGNFSILVPNPTYQKPYINLLIATTGYPEFTVTENDYFANTVIKKLYSSGSASIDGYTADLYVVQFATRGTSWNCSVTSTSCSANTTITLTNTYSYNSMYQLQSISLTDSVLTDDYLANMQINQNNQIIEQGRETNEKLDNLDDTIQSGNQAIQDSITESNKETQEVIKDQFNNCDNYFNINSIENGTISGTTGENANSTGRLRTKNFIFVNKNENYTLSLESEYVIQVYIFEYDKNKNFIKRIPVIWADIPYTFTTDIEANYIKIVFANPNNSDILISDISNAKLIGKFCTNKIDETNDKLDGIQGALTDDSSPDLGALENSAGWLPPGPVDSILNLPLSLLNNLSTTLNKSCNPVILTLPYVNKTITLPCIKDLYDKMGVTGTIFNWAGIIAAAFILYNYLLRLYKWVDDTLTMRENNLPGYFDDNWGGGA